MTTFRFLKDAAGGTYRLDLDERGLPVAAFRRFSAKDWRELPPPAASGIFFSPGEYEFILETDTLPLVI